MHKALKYLTMEQIFVRYNPWWEKTDFKSNAIPRPSIENKIFNQINTNPIIFITGLRRVGKSTLLKSIISHLINNQNIEPTRILYVSLDHFVLSKSSLLEIVDNFLTINKISFGEKIWLFFDEITYIQDFEVQLKNLYDLYQAKIFATSSSASLLKSKLHLLTGRHRIFELLPLDFWEYLLFKNIHVSRADQNLLKTYFHEYLTTGGMPEYVLTGEMDYLTTLAESIIMKDIAALHKIKEIQALKDMFLLLMERAGKRLSVNKIANLLKISPDTARRFMSYFLDTYLVYQIPQCGKTNQRLLSPTKVYASDIGIRTAFTGKRDYGSLFENYVFLKIKHRLPCYVYDGGVEIDFMTQDGLLVEAKYHDEPMSEKQQKLFDQIVAKQKIIVRDYKDVEALRDE